MFLKQILTGSFDKKNIVKKVSGIFRRATRTRRQQSTRKKTQKLGITTKKRRIQRAKMWPMMLQLTTLATTRISSLIKDPMENLMAKVASKKIVKVIHIYKYDRHLLSIFLHYKVVLINFKAKRKSLKCKSKNK